MLEERRTSHPTCEKKIVSAVGIGLLPSAADMQRIIACQKQIAQIEQLSFLLNDTDCLPHLSLIHICGADAAAARRSAEQGFEKLIGTLPIDGGIVGHVYVSHGWYFCDVERDEKLMGFHQRAFDMAAPYLQAGSKTDKDISHYSEHEKKMYSQYGYRFIGQSFAPHVTLGRTFQKSRSPRHAEIVALCQNQLWGTIRFDRLAMFDVGENGTCDGLYYES